MQPPNVQSPGKLTRRDLSDKANLLLLNRKDRHLHVPLCPGSITHSTLFRYKRRTKTSQRILYYGNNVSVSRAHQKLRLRVWLLRPVVVCNPISFPVRVMNRFQKTRANSPEIQVRFRIATVPGGCLSPYENAVPFYPLAPR